MCNVAGLQRQITIGGRMLRAIRADRGRLLPRAVAALLLIITPSAKAATPQQHAASNAAMASRHADEPPEVLGPVSTSEKQGYGCLIGGTASLAIASIGGTQEAIILFTGATALPAATPFGLGLAVAGTIFASTCAVGALVAPTALRLWRIYYEGAEVAQTPP